MAYLAEHRNRFKVPANGVVEIRADFDGGEPALYLQCAPCGDEMGTDADRSLFECGSCGYTMTREEANGLATEYVRALSSVFDVKQQEEKRGIRWLLVTLFGSKRKRRRLMS